MKAHHNYRLIGFSLCAIAGVLLQACMRISDPATTDALAVRAIRRLNDSEKQYLERVGHYGSLADLGPAGASLIQRDLADGVAVGYRFKLDLNNRGYIIRLVRGICG